MELEDDEVRGLVERLREIGPGYFDYLTPALLVQFFPEFFYWDNQTDAC